MGLKFDFWDLVYATLKSVVGGSQAVDINDREDARNFQFWSSQQSLGYISMAINATDNFWCGCQDEPTNSALSIGCLLLTCNLSFIHWLSQRIIFSQGFWASHGHPSKPLVYLWLHENSSRPEDCRYIVKCKLSHLYTFASITTPSLVGSKNLLCSIMSWSSFALLG